MAQLHRAAWVLPISGPPVQDGWVLVDRGKILQVGGPGDGPSNREPISAVADSVVILPGLVNAHTHLELSWMRNRVPRSSSMPAWIDRLLALRRGENRDPGDSIAGAIGEMRATGTALVGDVTNTLASRAALAASGMPAAVFLELIGFDVSDPKALVADAQSKLAGLAPVPHVRAAVVPHAPYSVSPDLLQAIAAAAGGAPMSVHLGESPEEIEFLRAGTGAWRRLLEHLGAWSDRWSPPACGPVDYLADAGLLNEHLLAVHSVQLTDSELARLAAARATVVTCPRSNQWTGAGTPPIARFYDSGVRVAIGTDSLASVEDLNLFNEAAAVRRLAPRVPASRIVRSATLDGAAALGFGDEFGSIEPGKRAELIAVRLPAGVGDVEEYLLSGRLSPSDIRWLETA